MAKVNDDKTQDALDTAADSVRDAVNKTADAASGVARKGSDSASESVDTAQQNISAGLHEAGEGVSDISDNATGAIKKYPVRTVLLVAIGAAIAGFIVGIVTPRKG